MSKTFRKPTVGGKGGRGVSDSEAVSEKLSPRTLYFSEPEWQAIRRAAFEQDRAYSDIVREAVRRLLSVPEPKSPKGTKGEE